MEKEISHNRALALLVDDQSDVLVTTGAFLEAAGFDVVRASNGDEALSHLATGEIFVLLVTDYAMPGLNGLDLATQALERLPTLKILIITGFPNTIDLDKLPQGVALLIKPFRRAALTAQVNSLFGSVPSSLQTVSFVRNEDRGCVDEAPQSVVEAYSRNAEHHSPADSDHQRQSEGRQHTVHDRHSTEELYLWADVFRNIAFGFALMDTVNNIICFPNEALAVMHGASIEGLSGATVTSLYAPAERVRIESMYITADRNGYAFFDAEGVRKDGSVFPSQTHITSVRRDNTDVLYRIVAIQTIPAHRQIEAERDQNQRSVSTTLSSQILSSPPIDGVAEGMWRIACGKNCRETWVLLAEQEKDRWRSNASALVRGWVARAVESTY